MGLWVGPEKSSYKHEVGPHDKLAAVPTTNNMALNFL
jgi:hypothetical protein